jgi:signal transduction histidine kinase
MSEPLRRSGIEPLGDLPWGTHFCHFFGSAADLLETLVPYFKAGIDGGEACLWLFDAPLTEKEVWSALQGAVSNLDDYRRRGGVEVSPCRAWYTRGGMLAVDGAIAAFDVKLAAALAHGFVGLRVSGCETWLPRGDWSNFIAFEREFDAALAGRRMVVSCSYPLATSSAEEVLDVAQVHQLAVAKREGRWEVVETPELRQAKADLDRLNRELEERVAKRTEQLAKLSRRLFTAQEEERRRLAVELHDELGQILTAVKIQLESLVEACALPPAAARLGAAISSVDQAMERVRDLALALRPSVLDDLGLPAALRWYVDRFARASGLEAHLALQPLPRLDHAVETACFRVTQEALTNVARHAQAQRIWVELQRTGDELELRVRDDGVGFDVGEAGARSAVGAAMGLLGMKERSALVGGSLQVNSQPGAGTEIVARYPLLPRPEEKSG